MVIYHVILPRDWENVKGTEFYSAPSLADEGFIHCSFEDQIERVLARYYSEAPEVVLLTIETSLLTAKLVTEPSTGGEVYPHIYGPINVNAVVGTESRALNG